MFPAVIAQEGLVVAPAGAAPENSAVLVSPAAAITAPAAMPSLVSRLRVRRVRRAVLAVLCDGIWWLRMTTPTIFYWLFFDLMPVSEIRGLPPRGMQPVIAEALSSVRLPRVPASRPGLFGQPRFPRRPGTMCSGQRSGAAVDDESGVRPMAAAPGGLLTLGAASAGFCCL